LLAQANAVSDKLLDLRSCVYTGKNLADKVLSGALVADADFSNTVMSNVTMTKSYAKGANFSGMQQLLLAHVLAEYVYSILGQECWPTSVLLAGSDLTNSVLDRVDFTDANLSHAKFTNAVITGAKFAGANLDGATFEDALIGQEDYKQLWVILHLHCSVPTVCVLAFLQTGNQCWNKAPSWTSLGCDGLLFEMFAALVLLDSLQIVILLLAACKSRLGLALAGA
jgi:hypothetical protein